MMKPMWIMAALLMTGLSFAESAEIEKMPCRDYVDADLHVRFPARMDTLRLRYRSVPGNDGNAYGLTYSGDLDDDPAHGERTLTLSLAPACVPSAPDDANRTVSAHLEKCFKGEALRSRDCESYRSLDMQLAGKLNSGAIQYMWTSCTKKRRLHTRTLQSVSLAFAWRGHLFHLLYEEPILRGRTVPCETLPDSVRRILGDVERLIADAERAYRTDIYALKDDCAALEALRAKWLGAEQSLSQYEMPLHTEKGKVLNRLQRWCCADITRRVGKFEETCLEGVLLKIDPPLWYYNLACARALQGKTEPAFEALEQSVAAGRNDARHLRADEDLASLRADPRFERLAAMAERIGTDRDRPRTNARIASGRLYLDESNVRWAYDVASYEVAITNADGNTLVYYDHNLEHGSPPGEDLVEVIYDENFTDFRQDVGRANLHFLRNDGKTSVPALMGCRNKMRGNTTNRVTSVIARLWEDEDDSEDATWHLYANVLGVYAAFSDCREDGLDRIAGWSPVALAYADCEPEDDLVNLCGEIWRALSPDVRAHGGVRQIPAILRRCQRGVANEADFRSSRAQRPAILCETLDAHKARELAAGRTKPYPEIPVIASSELTFVPTPVTDLWCGPFNLTTLFRAPHGVAFVCRWAERTARFEIRVRRPKGELVWKVLQGDTAKVRFTRKDPVTENGKTYDVVEIACDYHAAFDAVQADGTKLRSTRVDIGCFAVEDGESSLPAVVSVYYSPSETRTYGADGRLATIDYTKPQVPGWLPAFCPRGDFTDTFQWRKDGHCAGWTRRYADGRESEFTPGGLVVMSRDAKGRPLDVRRNLLCRWIQTLDPGITNCTEEARQCDAALDFDSLSADPYDTTLAWRFAYSNETDCVGKARPLPARPFRHRPSYCPHAHFAKGSGFRLPIIRQMTLGLERYDCFKFDLLHGAAADRTPLRMRFCPFVPASNDVWKIETDDFDRAARSVLVEQADGACRMRSPTDTNAFLSVRGTFRVLNEAHERLSYKKLDDVYRRCPEDETRALLPAVLCDPETDCVQVSEGVPLLRSQLEEGVTKSVALWQVRTNLYFGILADWTTYLHNRRYFFAAPDEDGAVALAVFEDLPARALGNTVCRAADGDPEAYNNYAALAYAGVLFPDAYDEATVTRSLTYAAERGCATAIHNLGVLRHNNGETFRAQLLFNASRP